MSGYYYQTRNGKRVRVRKASYPLNEGRRQKASVFDAPTAKLARTGVRRRCLWQRRIREAQPGGCRLPFGKARRSSVCSSACRRIDWRGIQTRHQSKTTKSKILVGALNPTSLKGEGRLYLLHCLEAIANASRCRHAESVRPSSEGEGFLPSDRAKSTARRIRACSADPRRKPW